ncbi:hypothetical protein SK128_015090 [Halocaridina rubra]|uniref:Menorin-like domain-containing protein n=1 Tax=Halocaridina rubra TaxID=373956 RepID=A0AAN8WWG2_HALRR
MTSQESSVDVPDVADFFPDVSDDLSKVTWAHAVNSKEDVDTYLGDNSTMMLEADIMPGRLTDADPEGPLIPIMAHPPIVVSDISFEMWITAVIKANQDGKKKGAKLDFKDITVVEDCLKILKGKANDISFPLWLNADILKGPVGDTRDPVDADKFLTLCMEYFPQATLSVGWTTKYTTSDDEDALYTKATVEEMVTTLEEKNVAQPVTFPIRAAFVPRSLDNLDWLVETVPDSTITVWSSESDTVDIQALLALRSLIGHDAVYYDLPEDQKKAFEEARDAQSSSEPSFRFWPSNTSALVTVGVALASALASLYLYE